MTRHDEADRKHEGGEETPPEARLHPAEWSPWVWVIPAVAILVVGWLVIRYGFFGGADITVRFVEARGIDRYSPVRYRGAKVGSVQEISVDEELREVAVRITMDAGMSSALREGTRFWIVEPGLERGIGSLISGTYIAMAPGEGEEVREFQGLEHPPILAAPEPGKVFILETERAASVSIGSPVKFRGMEVGRVLGAEYDHARGVTHVHVFVVERFRMYVRESSAFWQGGGLSVAFEGGRLSVGDGDLTSMLTTAVNIYTPVILAGPPAPEGARFILHSSRGAAIAAAGGPHLDYVTYFPGPVNGLAAGTSVEMKGVQVGRVREVRLRYLEETESLQTPVILEIDPRLLELDVPPVAAREELRERMNEALQALVRKGMRATLSSSLILPGATAVSLRMVGAPGTARLNLTTEPPTIPASAAGDGLQDAMNAISRVAARIEELPLREIAGDLRSAARRVDALVADPRIEESLESLNQALNDIESAAGTAEQNIEPIAESLRRAAASVESAAATIESVAGTAGANIEPIAESLRDAAAAAEAAARRANALLGAAPRQNYDLAELVREVTRAAEAVRALASYLTEHPDALLKGRTP